MHIQAYTQLFEMLLWTEERQLENDIRLFDLKDVTMKIRGEFLSLMVCGLVYVCVYVCACILLFVCTISGHHGV
jgi:hypothetical protein